MAKVYKSVKGRKLTHLLATLDGVRDHLEARTFEMAVRAEEDLVTHRLEGHASIEIEHGDVDWYVVLTDERGQKAAMSIEYGRAGYIDPDEDPQTRKVYGAMEGLYILHKATHIPRREKKRVPKERRRKNERTT